MRSTVILKDTVNWPADGIPGLTGHEICVVLTKGYIALVSPEDAEELSGYNWHTLLSKQQVIAVRNSTPDERGKQKKIYMHRWLMKPTADQEVDHRDQHCFFCYKVVDNRRENLRNGSASQNQANRRKQVGCTSSYMGVCWLKRNAKWMAQIMANQRKTYLGSFDTQLEAAMAYDSEHRNLFPGIHEGLNFPKL